MSEEDSAESLRDTGKRLLFLLLVIVLIALVSYGLYAGATYEGPTTLFSLRMPFYTIVGVATISLALGMLVAIVLQENNIVYYLAIPYFLLVLVGAILEMVVLSSIDFVGIFFVLLGHWGLAGMIWWFKEHQSEG